MVGVDETLPFGKTPRMQGEHDRLGFTTGERIGWLMKRQGRKPGELGDALGIDATSFWRYRRDERPIPHTVLSRLADELLTTTDFLAGRTDDPRPTPVAPAESTTARKRTRAVRGMDRRASDLVLSTA